MKNITRIFAFLLALVMISCVLASCGEPKNDPDAPSTTAKPSETQGPVETSNNQNSSEEIRVYPDLPDVRYDGYTYRVRVKGDATHWSTLGIYAETKTGEPINDATLERNNSIKEKYGIDIVTVEGSGMSGDTVNMVLSQVDEWDAAVITVDSIPTVAPKSVYDLKQLKYIDLSKPWYDQKFNKEVSIGGRLYATTGDYVINDDNGTWVTLFNKTLAEDYADIPNLYKLSLDGGWTLDKQYEYAKVVADDITGDHAMDENDRWGLLTEDYNLYASIAAAGEKIASKDGDDMPYLTASSERFQDVLSKAVQVHGDKSVALLYSDYSGRLSGYDFYYAVFNESRALMQVCGLYDLGIKRVMDDDVGVLPMPKYDEAQESYLDPITVYNATCVVIPITVSDAERTAVITEALFAESRYTTRIAFYETTLKKKYSPDEETKLVLDQVIENRTYDLGAIYSWGGVVSRLSTMMQSRASNFSSAWRSLERVAQKAMETTVKDFQKAWNVGE